MSRVIDVAKNIINMCNNEGISITNLKLQKLLYFAQGMSYKINNRPIFDEDLEAWQLGAVSPEAYRKYCFYGASEIPIQSDNINLDDEDIRVLEKTIEKYGSMSAWRLVEETCKQSPWDYAYNIVGERAIIYNESIRREFKNSNKTENSCV